MRIFWLSLLLLFSSAFANTEQISFEEDAEEIPTNVKDDTALMLENDYQNGVTLLISFFTNINEKLSELNGRVQRMESQIGILQQNVSQQSGNIQRLKDQVDENKVKSTGVKECSKLSGMLITPLLKIGTRVVRGPDWKWDDQDGAPGQEGQVTSLEAPGRSGMVTVKWTSGNSSNYRMGSSGKYDLKLAECSLTIKDPSNLDCLKSDAPTPSGSEMARRLKYGTLVVRGADWRWGNQDGNPPGIGLVVDKSGWVIVAWSDGSTNSYRMVEENKYDLKFVDCSRIRTIYGI